MPIGSGLDSRISARPRHDPLPGVDQAELIRPPDERQPDQQRRRFVEKAPTKVGNGVVVAMTIGG
jgi:hypothetical protein